MAKGFGKGFLTGVLSTVALAAGAVFTVHKTIIEPEEKKEAFIEENRKKLLVNVWHIKSWQMSSFFCLIKIP